MIEFWDHGPVLLVQSLFFVCFKYCLGRLSPRPARRRQALGALTSGHSKEAQVLGGLGHGQRW